jgi:DNA-binding NtrC family response regulator
MNRVLIYEPDATTAARYKECLQKQLNWVVVAQDADSARALLQKQYFHLCVWPVEEGARVEDLFQLKKVRPAMAVVATSLSAEPSLVVACMRAGASHYWVRSESVESLREVVAETLARVVPDGINEKEVPSPFPQFEGRHPRILEIYQLIQSIKNTDSTVLITGESGTGKDVVAHAIHDLSPRRSHRLVAVNCGAIPANLLESELFGHMKGAFTGATQNRMGRFQLAGAGTLFLDEISDLSFDLQAKILRAIQNKVFEPVGSPQSQRLEARIIAATNQDLETAVAERRFREDLYYRLNVIPIYIPPLRSRKSDIPLLASSFLEKFSAQNGKQITGIAEEAMRCLMQYHWPGNIRELENLMERVVVLKKGDGILELKDFSISSFQNVRLDRFVANVALPDDGLDFNDAVNEFENELILQALQKTAGNKNKAATLLNLNRTTLVEKLKRKGLRLAS